MAARVFCSLRAAKHRGNGIICCSVRWMSSIASSPEELRKLGQTPDATCNIPSNIIQKVGRNLHNQQHHPLNIIKKRIVESLNKSCQRRNREIFQLFDSLSPFVSVQQNFNDLLVPPNHVSRRPSDTYYINANTVLRTHTSAHQSELIRAAHRSFLVASDVYRRDEIDSSHYPVFHQMEGVRLFPTNSPLLHGQHQGGEIIDSSKILEGENQTGPIPGDAAYQPAHQLAAAKFVESDLKQTVVDMAEDLFGKGIQMRWVDAFFPFTRPSWELEIFFQDRWMEVMGCGVIQQRLLANNNAADQIGWAFGFGLERLALKLFNIPDVRLFWSEDPRFLQQFDENKSNIQFQTYSKYPACYKDITFWLPSSSAAYHDNDFFELVRGIAGDLVESVQMIDEFTHPKTKRQSRCYRILYRSMDRSLTNEEINELQADVRHQVASRLEGELR